MRSRLAPLVVGLITLAMVVFGQICALSTLVAAHEVKAAEVESPSASEDHEATCDPSNCGGQDESDQHCPSGAPNCCSTWGPPNDRLSVSPPASLSLALLDAWLAVPHVHAMEERAAEVALFQLARPPSELSEVVLAFSLSRRGPPALA